MSIKWKAAIAGTVVGALALAGCGGSSSGVVRRLATPSNLVGFSILEQANKQVIADFNKTADGKGVTFKQSYGASGDQSRAVDRRPEGRLRAPLPRARRAEARRRRSWSPTTGSTTPTKGILTQSVVVIVVRKGNPKNITELGRPDQAGRQDHHPEPGLVRLGEVEHPRGLRPRARRRRHRGRRQAYLTKFFDNVAALPGSGRDATTAFPSGTRRRAALLRERGDPGPAERRGLRLRRPAGDPADPEPGRGHHRRRPGGQEVPGPTSPARRRRPTTPRRASARSTTASRSTSRAPTTRATRSRRRQEAADHRRRLRRLVARRTPSSSTRTTASSRRSSRRRARSRDRVP